MRKKSRLSVEPGPDICILFKFHGFCSFTSSPSLSGVSSLLGFPHSPLCLLYLQHSSLLFFILCDLECMFSPRFRSPSSAIFFSLFFLLYFLIFCFFLLPLISHCFVKFARFFTFSICSPLFTLSSAFFTSFLYPL